MEENSCCKKKTVREEAEKKKLQNRLNRIAGQIAAEQEKIAANDQEPRQPYCGKSHVPLRFKRHRKGAL